MFAALYRPGQANLQFSHCESNTMWKFQDFSVTQILREIIFGESKSCKIAVFTISGALNFVILVNFSPIKVQKY